MLPGRRAFGYDSIVVTDATGLDVIARLAETGLPEIRDLNPQYLRLATPPNPRRSSGCPPAPAPAWRSVTPSCALPAGPVHDLPGSPVRAADRHRGALPLPVARYPGGEPRVKGSRPRPGTVLGHSRGRGAFGAGDARHRCGRLVARPIERPRVRSIASAGVRR